MAMIKLTNDDGNDVYIEHTLIEVIQGSEHGNTCVTIGKDRGNYVKEKAHIVASKIAHVTRDDLVIVQYLSEAQCEDLGNGVTDYLLSIGVEDKTLLTELGIEYIKEYITKLMRTDEEVE